MTAEEKSKTFEKDSEEKILKKEGEKDKMESKSNRAEEESGAGSGVEGDGTRSEEKAETKRSLRFKVWNKMDKSGVVLFPRPCTFRIPHFKGELEAVERLAELEVFKMARVVKVSLDKAMESSRLEMVRQGKQLVVGCPGLKDAVFLHVEPPAAPAQSSVRLAATRLGICHLGRALAPPLPIDLVVVGSVAVDKTGRRIGKGEGFSDLEYALLRKLGGLTQDVPIVTLVHDTQVYDKLPEEIFKKYDVPVDLIVTPTQVIEVKPRRQRPQFAWEELSPRRVNDIPIIKDLMEKEIKDGKEVVLKTGDVDSDEREDNVRLRRVPMRRGRLGGGRRRRVSAPPEWRQRPPTREGSAPPTRPTRTFRRKRFARGAARSELDSRRRGARPLSYAFRPRYKVDFSLKVDGLTAGMRVRDLKAALIERGVRPRDISWMSNKGMAFLHFAKPRPSAPTLPTDVIASLRGLTVKCDSGPETNLKVEQALPVRRPTPV